MFYDREKEEFYCIRCQYTGSEADVLKMNQLARIRYRMMDKRIESFD